MRKGGRRCRSGDFCDSAGYIFGQFTADIIF